MAMAISLRLTITYLLWLASTRAPTRLGKVAEANYVISAFFPRQTRKSVRIIVSWDTITNLFILTADIPGSVLRINPEGREMSRKNLLTLPCLDRKISAAASRNN